MLAGSVATLGVIGATYAFLSHMNVALGVVLLMLGVYTGMFFLACITGRYTIASSYGDALVSPNVWMVLGSLIVATVAFIGAVLLIT